MPQHALCVRVLDNPGYHRPQGLHFNEFALCDAVNIDTGGTKGKLVQMPKTCFFKQSLTSASVLIWFLFVSFVGFGFILFCSALAWRILGLGVKLEGRFQLTGSELNKPVSDTSESIQMPVVHHRLAATGEATGPLPRGLWAWLPPSPLVLQNRYPCQRDKDIFLSK